jgi:predicted regulator of Ras-like GTPase activity (Roadblock/LC7/MglB family)
MNGLSTTLLKPKSLNNVLAQANTGGVSCTILLNLEGSLLAHAGSSTTEAITIAALASTIWKNYQRYGNSALHEDKLKTAVIQSQDSNLIVQNLSNVLLCICADQCVPLGMLKCKAKSICDHLEEPLNMILKN